MHVMRFCAAAACGLLALSTASAQATQRGAPNTPDKDESPVSDTSMFAPLPMPPGNIYRSGSGMPGPRYWQQRADYVLKATLDTGANTVRGEETIRYTNNSPDTLRYVWLQVEQNAFKSGSLNSLVFPPTARFGALNFQGGDMIDHVNEVASEGGRGGRATKGGPLKSRVEDTMMQLELSAPLAPGQSTTFDIAWHFSVPEHGADRMGHEGTLYEIAQWYPRLCVYDDLKGWNTEPYLGQGEFYLEYGDFDVSVTVPAGYIVAGTGTLQNASEVLTPSEVTRLAQAAKSDNPVHIITQEEITSGAARPKKTGTLTWHFKSHNTRDAVWAASPDYMWDASSWNGHLAQAYYRPSAIDTWKEAADMARMSIQEYSERWYQYPYPQISVVEGPVSGMEYPMLAMEAKSADKYELYNVITHEVGHNWFPMIVGSNERVHFWQDEGFNTFINYFSEARRYPEKGDELHRAEADLRTLEQVEQHNVDEPIEVPADRINPNLLGVSEYQKTAAGLHLLRTEILGPAAFDAAFREYIRRWAYKHPSPNDFFRTMEDVSGKQLSWFWREWFIENPHFDQTIDTVATRQRGDSEDVIVRYANRAAGVLPIHAQFTFSDGSTQMYDYPAEVWSTNTTFYDRRYAFAGKKVTKIILDPDERLVDVDRANNVKNVP